MHKIITAIHCALFVVVISITYVAKIMSQTSFSMNDIGFVNGPYKGSIIIKKVGILAVVGFCLIAVMPSLVFPAGKYYELDVKEASIDYRKKLMVLKEFNRYLQESVREQLLLELQELLIWNSIEAGAGGRICLILKDKDKFVKNCEERLFLGLNKGINQKFKGLIKKYETKVFNFTVVFNYKVLVSINDKVYECLCIVTMFGGENGYSIKMRNFNNKDYDDLWDSADEIVFRNFVSDPVWMKEAHRKQLQNYPVEHWYMVLPKGTKIDEINKISFNLSFVSMDYPWDKVID